VAGPRGVSRTSPPRTSAPRIEWRRVDGVLLLDKPLGLTSNAALQRVRRLYRAERAGHSGTLDPLATGLLPVLFGEATKFGAEMLAADKRYRATIALGARTSTGDAEGEVIERHPVDVARAGVETVLRRFVGRIEQTPPMYSALKRGGRPLYAYARAGETVEREPRIVTIHELRLEAFAGACMEVDVRCSKGTYIRTLAEDIGAALGCGAHLGALRRTEVGPFRLAEAHALADLECAPEAERFELLLPVDRLLAHLPPVALEPDAAARFAHGQTVTAPAGFPSGPLRVYGAGGRLLGVGDCDADGLVQPRRLVRQDVKACEPP
jgi:tRNA pseudouridine55 synthase